MSFNFTASLESQFLDAWWIFLIMKEEKKKHTQTTLTENGEKTKKSHAHTCACANTHAHKREKNIYSVFTAQCHYVCGALIKQ